MFGQQIAASVVEEKQSRLVEIIATAIPLRHLLAGKVVGNSVIALGQVVLFAGVGLVAVSFTDGRRCSRPCRRRSCGSSLFFAVGFFALACLYAVAGALASRTEDLQSTTAPMTTVLMVVYFASFGLSGKALEVGLVRADRVGRGDAGPHPRGRRRVVGAGVALLVMAAFSAVTIVVSERIYRRSLLQTRGRVSWKQALSARGVSPRHRAALLRAPGAVTWR